MLHYLPGCDVRKNHQDSIEKLTNYMKEKGALIEECCRTSERLAKENEIIVQNCTMCELILNEVQTAKVISLYEYVLLDQSFPFVDLKGKKLIVQDCWRMKDSPQIHQAIRECLKRMNVEIIELEENKERSTYCGVWNLDHLTPIALELAPDTFGELEKEVKVYSEDEKVEMMKEYAKKISGEVVCYCNGCERGLKMGSITVFHMVDLLAKGL